MSSVVRHVANIPPSLVQPVLSFTEARACTSHIALSSDQGAFAISTSVHHATQLWDLRGPVPVALQLPHPPWTMFGGAIAEPEAGVAAAAGQEDLPLAEAELQGFAEFTSREALGDGDDDGRSQPRAENDRGQTSIGLVHVWHLPRFRHQLQRQWTLRRPRMRTAVQCALSADGAVLLAAFIGSQSSGGGEVVRCSQSASGEWAVEAQWTLPRQGQPLALSMAKDASLLLVSASDSINEYTVHAMDARTGTILQSWYPAGFSNVDVDATGARVVIGDSDQLRVYTMGTDLFNHRTRQLPTRTSDDSSSLVKSADVHSDGALDATSDDMNMSICNPTIMHGYTKSSSNCTISGEGSIVLAAMFPSHDVGVWDASTGTLLARLQSHSSVVNAIAISTAGVFALTAEKNNTVCAWRLDAIHSRRNARKLLPVGLRPLSNALRNVLATPDLFLSEETLRRVVRSANLTDAAELLCGHNLVLLAMRSGIMNDDHSDESQSLQNLFREELYMPAHTHRWRTRSEQCLAQLVLAHASKLGLLKGVTPAAHLVGTRYLTHQDWINVNSIVKSASDSVCGLEQPHAEFGLISVEQKGKNASAGQAVLNLSRSLSELRRVLHANHPCHKLTTLAKVGVSFTALVVYYTSKYGDVGAGFRNDHGPATRSPVAETSNVYLTTLDFSDASHARQAFSEQGMTQLNHNAKKSIEIAVEQSEFKTLVRLRHVLETCFVNFSLARHADPNTSDVRSPEVLRNSPELLSEPKSSTPSIKDTGEVADDELWFNEHRAQECFKLACIGDPFLTFMQAIVEIEAELSRAGWKFGISQDEIYDEVENADRDGDDRLNLPEFVMAFKNVGARATRSIAMELLLLRKLSDRFDKAAGTPTAEIYCRHAVRIIISVLSDSMDINAEKHRPSALPVSTEAVTAMFSQRGIFRSSMVHKDVFLAVAREAVLGNCQSSAKLQDDAGHLLAKNGPVLMAGTVMGMNKRRRSLSFD